ncbi:hypothetical protein FQN53_007344 [Emmonsiellopsis sp. PD_33]|nr:hypothetical protein FQN53_007344 [Emmonsiellopsis sp. PD_33]
MSSTPSHPGILHSYAPRLTAFEYASPKNTTHKPHSLIFIGGLGDGFYTVPYLNDLAAALETSSWSVYQVLLTSSYSGWGLASLDGDVDEIGQCVDYVKSYKSASAPAQNYPPGKVVIMGHSTGSQDTLHYLYSQNPGSGNIRPPVDGAILQAPVSDREAILNTIRTGNEYGSPEELQKAYDELITIAQNQTQVEGKDTLLPLWLLEKIGLGDTTPISSRRFLSLASPDSPERPQEDDLFSSDLTDARLRETFGMVGSRGLLKKSLLAIPGGADEYAAPWLDKEGQLKRWEEATKGGSSREGIWDPNSAVIPGATHSPTEPGPKQELIARVKAFLANIEKDD